ncbi:MAG: hypothetical protein LBK94_10945 [Prevotellaceae bacterium]|jgi:hypothetical protein|nr:hypothetical protein [Prevotellaceae bacterium]
MSNDKLKDLFHEKLYSHETEVSESDWEVISERIRKKHRRKIIPMFYIYGTTGVAVALLIIMFLVKPDTANITDVAISRSNGNEQTVKSEKTDTAAEINQNKQENKNSLTDINQNKQENKNIIENINKSVEIAYSQNNEYNTKGIPTKNTDENINKHIDEIEKIDCGKFAPGSIDFITANETGKTAAKTLHSIDREESKAENSGETKQTNAGDEWWNQIETETAKEKNKNTLTLALESGNNIGKNSVTGDFTNSGSKYNAAQYPETAADMPALSATPMSSHVIGSDYKTDMKHKRPLNFGIRIKKSIGKNIVIKTGLSYSYFLSESSNNANQKSQQKIHYVGIPLGFEYLILKKNNFNIYLSGEFAAEKGILYSYKEATINVSAKEFKTTENRSVRGIQFSTNAGLGVSYNFITNIGIYVEPNVVYYIKDINQPPNFRTEKPFNFGLNIGLKYDF